MAILRCSEELCLHPSGFDSAPLSCQDSRPLNVRLERWAISLGCSGYNPNAQVGIYYLRPSVLTLTLRNVPAFKNREHAGVRFGLEKTSRAWQTSSGRERDLSSGPVMLAWAPTRRNNALYREAQPPYKLGLKTTRSGSGRRFMNYEQKLNDALEAVKREGRYRVFADLKRHRGAFPKADFIRPEDTRPITVWCSNDYLGMGQHPKVLAAMHEAHRPRRRWLGRHAQHFRHDALSRRTRSTRSPTCTARKPRCCSPRPSSPTKRRCRRWFSCCPAASSSRTRRTTPR